MNLIIEILFTLKDFFFIRNQTCQMVNFHDLAAQSREMLY